MVGVPIFIMEQEEIIKSTNKLLIANVRFRLKNNDTIHTPKAIRPNSAFEIIVGR